MEWQTADWFFVVILLVFIAMHFVGHGAHGARGKNGGTDGQQGPIINM